MSKLRLNVLASAMVMLVSVAVSASTANAQNTIIYGNGGYGGYGGFGSTATGTFGNNAMGNFGRNATGTFGNTVPGSYNQSYGRTNGAVRTSSRVTSYNRVSSYDRVPHQPYIGSGRTTSSLQYDPQFYGYHYGPSISFGNGVTFGNQPAVGYRSYRSTGRAVGNNGRFSHR